MKVAITSKGPDLDSPGDPRFGRCCCVLIVDTQTMNLQAIQNPYVSESGDAGRHMAGLLSSHGVQMVLTQDVGPRARDVLDAAGIPMTPAQGHTSRGILQAFNAGVVEHVEADEPQSTPNAPASDPGSGTLRGGRRVGHRGGTGKVQRRRRRRGQWRK